MKLPPFEEFIKSITPVVQNNQNEGDITETQKVIDVLMKEINKISFNHIECYHNWLTEQLEGSVKSTETDAE